MIILINKSKQIPFVTVSTKMNCSINEIIIAVIITEKVSR